ALLDQGGKLVTLYNRGAELDRGPVQQALERTLASQAPTVLLAFDGRLYEVALQPLLFGSPEAGTRLGYIAVGYAIDHQVAREIAEAAAAEVAFVVDGRIAASTLAPELQKQLMERSGDALLTTGANQRLTLGREQYLVTTASLSNQPAVRLVVMKSFEPATQLVRDVNRWVLLLGLLTVSIGTLMFLSVSRALTRPLETLVEGARALGEGNFEYKLSESGAEEIRELSRAFERMRVELRHTEAQLIDTERLATIGRMASSISHDLRHYLSAMYANAEFMSSRSIPQAERELLLEEVRTAVQGMTGLLDSLLLFTQTGRALHPEAQPLDAIVDAAANMVRSHPASYGVEIVLDGLVPLVAWVDGKKLGRAVYNILLNGCQAAIRDRARGGRPPVVTVAMTATGEEIRIQISDNGPGIAEEIRQKIFLPVISEGRESGIGLGLTLAQQIAQEHGGRIELSSEADESGEHRTTFTIILPASLCVDTSMVPRAVEKNHPTQPTT
ncbi:MAG: HAMP domain-containing histidine kinase, partial [Acidobacteriaceae bacterium]|nr:HAMP domain-containing histidine kinase [Acidobacteriaceae bacterium]